MNNKLTRQSQGPIQYTWLLFGGLKICIFLRVQFLTAPYALGEWSPTPVAHGPISKNATIWGENRPFELKIGVFRGVSVQITI